MSLLGTFTKQPAEKIDYDIDYSAWLTPGDDIASVVVTIDKTGLTIPQPQQASPVIKVWVSGGVDGAAYKITVTATTDDGRLKQDEFKIKIKDS